MGTIRQELTKLEAEANLVDTLRTRGKTEGNRLTDFGQDFTHICIKHGIPNATIAKVLDITPGAVSQWVTKIKN